MAEITRAKSSAQSQISTARRWMRPLTVASTDWCGTSALSVMMRLAGGTSSPVMAPPVPKSMRVYGVLATATQEELGRLYAHARDVLGEVYLPQAVIAERLDGCWQPALCYLAREMEPRSAESDYVGRIV